MIKQSYSAVTKQRKHNLIMIKTDVIFFTVAKKIGGGLRSDCAVIFLIF